MQKKELSHQLLGCVGARRELLGELGLERAARRVRSLNEVPVELLKAVSRPDRPTGCEDRTVPFEAFEPVQLRGFVDFRVTGAFPRLGQLESSGGGSIALRLRMKARLHESVDDDLALTRESESTALI